MLATHDRLTEPRRVETTKAFRIGNAVNFEDEYAGPVSVSCDALFKDAPATLERKGCITLERALNPKRGLARHRAKASQELAAVGHEKGTIREPDGDGAVNRRLDLGDRGAGWNLFDLRRVAFGGGPLPVRSFQDATAVNESEVEKSLADLCRVDRSRHGGDLRSTAC